MRPIGCCSKIISQVQTTCCTHSTEHRFHTFEVNISFDIEGIKWVSINPSYFSMMKVDLKLVERLASLAKLSFNTEEKERLVNDLERMIGFVDTLDQLIFPMRSQ